MIKLVAEPGCVVSWEQFVQNVPPFSIALDGYIDTPPCFSPDGPHANFDHHTGVNRLATRSTSMQVYLAITLGLFDLFRDEDGPRATVYVNDADQDVCLSYWMLCNPDKILQLRVEQPITRLLLSEDLIDTTGGAYPVPSDHPMIRKIGWIYEPYTTARCTDALKDMSGSDMAALIHTVCERIAEYAEGRGAEVDLDDRYEIIGGGPGWKMIVEQGAYARTQLFASGVPVVVTVHRNADGTHTYALAKMSPFVRFPLKKIFAALNEEEGEGDSGNAWGGSDTIGGSPRRTGSRLPPAVVEIIIKRCIGAE